MKRLYYSVILLVSLISFTACGGGGSSSGGDSLTTNGVSGNVVDNYIKGATVCIDTNKNNYCDSAETTTTTDENGSFSFPQTLNDDDIIISYGGVDAITGESFNYITKNIASNKDSNGKVILSSINTLIVDYMQETNSSLSVATTAIVDFLGGGAENISADMAISDVIANRTTQEEELERSLKLFQMVAKLNDNNDSNSSAKSFQELARFISENSSTRHSDNITITKDDNSTVVLNSSDYSPVVISVNSDDGYNLVYYTDLSNSDSYTIDAIDPNGGTITYGIINGKDSSAFTSTSTGFKFVNTPTYLDPQDEYNSTTQSSYDGQYVVDINISNGTTSTVKTFTIDVIESGKTIKPILSPTSITIENNSTEYPVDKVIGSVGVSNSGDSAIIKYELDSSNSYFDINRTNGNIFVLALPDVTGTDVDEQNLSIRAKNSAGWSDNIIVKIRTVANGELNTTATLENTTFSNVYENNSATQIVGNIPIANDGGQEIDDYNITSGNDDGYFDINSSGVLTATHSFDYDGGDTSYTIGVKAHNANGWGNEATIIIDIQNVNEAPSITGSEVVSQVIQDQKISLGTSTVLTFTLDDGDVGDQNITIETNSSNSSIVTSTLSKTNEVSGGEFTVTLYGVDIGTEKITIKLVDDGGTTNGGVDTKIYEFNTTIRANGWKLYENQRDSNYTIDSVTFDDITYDWNSTAMWYETADTILMPVDISNQYGKADNFIDYGEGHYDVNKSKFIYADRLPVDSEHSSDTEYTTANSDINMTVDTDYFAYDPLHKLFVSRVILNLQGDGYEGRKYSDSDSASSWMGDDNVTFVDAPDTNSSYGTDIAMSSYSSSSEQIDINNDGHSGDFCEGIYGVGWRIPTAYEIGIDITIDDSGYYGYIPAYVSNDSLDMITSTYSDNGYHWKFSAEDGKSRYNGADDSTYNIRCVYRP